MLNTWPVFVGIRVCGVTAINTSGFLLIAVDRPYVDLGVHQSLFYMFVYYFFHLSVLQIFIAETDQYSCKLTNKYLFSKHKHNFLQRFHKKANTTLSFITRNRMDVI